MELWQKIVQAYPNILQDGGFRKCGIDLQDDSDGKGAYIAKWDYSEPIPVGLKLGK